MYEYYLSVADIKILIKSEIKLTEQINFKDFLTNKSDTDYTCIFNKVENLYQLPMPVYEGDCYRVHKNQKFFLKSFFDKPGNVKLYAIGKYDYKNKNIVIEYDSIGNKYLHDLNNIFFHIGIEGLLIQEKKICFHSSFINSCFGGILFSGPSGIGKSTQADLWCKYTDARLINGDRPIVGMQNGVWRAWGSPYAGSSNCYINENYPISAIIMLEKSEKCSIKRLNINEAYKKIYSGITINSWDPEFGIHAFDIAVKMATDLPVYEYSCTPDLNSVEFLKRYLSEDLN